MAGLSPALKGNYRLVKIEPRVYIWRGQRFDLTTITLKQADELHAMGFMYLVKVRPKKRKAEDKNG